MKHFLALILFLSCIAPAAAQTSAKEKIDELLTGWHDAAARADFDDYFSKMAEEAVFIGTDPTENWAKPAFMNWAEPYFIKGKAWSFTTLERNIFLAEDSQLGWFDELLETQMGICRGSGVVSKVDGQWKIKHYVLSIAVPNENVSELTELKKDFDLKLITEFKTR